MMEKLRTFLFNGMARLARDGRLGFIPDGPFLRLQYYLKLGRVLHLKHPVLYNEKLQYIKLYDRDPRYSEYADKLAVRDFVSERAGDKYLIPMIARYDSADEIDWDRLPDRFVLKCTHGSGSNIICADKSKLDISDSRRKLDRWMSMNWFNTSREWPYKNIEPRIIVEEYLEGPNGAVPFDYKIMCFEGEPTYIIVDADRYSKHTRSFYDVNWIRQDMFNRHPGIPYEIERPEKLSEMLELARLLSRGLHHVRVDMYVVGGAIYFGEMTFFHGYGMEVYRPLEFERHMGDLINFPARNGGANE